MSKNACQCANRALNADNEPVPAGKTLTAIRRHAQQPGVLRYRGLEKEAVEAARVIKIETLMATLQAALDDLDLSVVDLLEPARGAQQARQR